MKRDYYAGALMCLIAAFTGYNAYFYNISLVRGIGSGFFPFSLSIALFIVGLLIAVNATDPVPDGLDHFADNASKYPDIRGSVAIIAGMVAFVVLTQTLGFVPGTFACVFLSAIGDREATWLGSLLLAAAVTLAGALIFIYALKINLPYFQFQGFSL